jgi:tetratricopeptide (TPR) repeat protein
VSDAPPPPERWRRIDEVFEQALAVPPSEREAFLDSTCAGDADLRSEVESLLRADAQAGTFLDTPALVSIQPEAPPLLLAAGTVLHGRYRVEEHVGHGAMGAVYRARDLSLETDVAVKTLDPHRFGGRARMDALRREVRLARRVTHPNVCRVHDVVEDGDPAFITMEYVPGESLAGRLERGDLPLAACLRVLAGVARGLAAAHAAGVVHRDLKPANVLLRADSGEPVVVDFGVAVESAGDGDGTRAGTRGYIAPEHLAGAAPDERSDLYSLGVLAHRLAAGALPGEPVARPVPPALAPLVDACLRRDPSERPADARAALALIEPMPGAPRRPVPWRLLAAASATAAVLLAAGPWRASRAAPAPIALAPVDASALSAEDAWLGETFRRLLAEELIDAWALDVRVIGEAGSPAGAVRPRLWTDPSGSLRATLASPAAEIQGASMRVLVERAARAVAVTLPGGTPAHPTLRELREVGARDPEAWRQLQRARRAARMEQWDRVRALMREAVERDPEFVMAWLELDFTYNEEDPARIPILDRVIDLGDRKTGLSPLSALAVEYGRASRRRDLPAVRSVLAEVGRLPLEGQDDLYVKFRLADVFFAQGRPEEGLPALERIAESWPQDAAAPKKLADYYLGYDEPVSPERALHYGRIAVALAPEDVACRANLARALLLFREEEAARAELAVVARADPDAKQSSFLGERRSRLFAAHMALGDVEAAAADARRMGLEPGIRSAEGRAAQAELDLSRGAFDEGLRGLASAAAEYERLDRTALAQIVYWQRAWNAYALGRRAVLEETCATVRARIPEPDESLSGQYARRTGVLCGLARLPPRGGKDVAALRTAIAALPEAGEERRWRDYFELLLRHRQHDWPGVVSAHRELALTGPALPVAFEAADALLRLGRPAEALAVYERLGADPGAWTQPYRRGTALLRAGELRARSGDAAGARRAYSELLRFWDRAPRAMPEVARAERGLRAGAAGGAVGAGRPERLRSDSSR